MSVIQAFPHPLAWDTVAEDIRNWAEEKEWPGHYRLAEDILDPRFGHKRYLFDAACKADNEILSEIDIYKIDKHLTAEQFFDALLKRGSAAPHPRRFGNRGF
jgi:hypothetical protein